MGVIESRFDKMSEKFKAYLADCERLPYGVAIVKNDAFSTIVEANPAYYRIIGHTKDGFLEQHGNRIADILIDNVYNIVEAQPRGADYDIEFDLRIHTAEGQIRWIHDFAHYDDQLNVFFITVTDITDKLLIQGSNLSYDAFQTKHEVLTYMAKYTSEHIVVTDAVTDEVVYMNPKAMKLLNFQLESDWLGKTYVDVMFGAPENVHPDYYRPAIEEYFMWREYYNPYHKKHVHVEAKIITIPALKRKMRLNVITDITAQKQLEYKMELHQTLHNCIDPLFTTATTSNTSEVVYYDILKQLRAYYDSNGAFFYKFSEGTRQLEKIYRVTADGVESVDAAFPFLVTDEQIELIRAVSSVNIEQNQFVLDEFGDVYKTAMGLVQLGHHVVNFSCVTVNNHNNDIVAFMGVTNPQRNADNKELMELLSRFVCMFMEHRQDQEIKEEAYSLEAVSKATLIEKCTMNFQNLGHAKDKINDTLDALSSHYDADFSIVLSRVKSDGSYGLTFVGGQKIPDLAVFSNQPGEAMGKWVEIFKKHSQFVTDAELDEPVILAMLKERFGIYNFIVSPIQNSEGILDGLVFVINYKFMNRAHFMVRVVTKNISDYLDRIMMHEKTQLEPATRLANKVTTQNRISKLLEAGTKGALFVIDIDNFKRLNDTLGHHVGDRALVDFAVILKRIFRTTDVIGRIGGDEFMVFAPNLIVNSLIETKANQVLTQCKRAYEKDGLTVEISVSIGVCYADEKCKTFQPLYENADYALYISKKSGKNRYHIYSDTEYLEDVSASDDLRFYHNVVHTLKSATENHYFVVHYQPLYHVPTGTYTQAEALVRIEKPDGTLIYPDGFIHVAESTGLVVEMTYQILEQVCRDFRKLLDEKPDTTLKAVSVNVPYLQFADPDMEERFMKILEKYDIAPNRIMLEITERTIIADMDLMSRKMASLVEKGFEFELDDFGTDYSNLQMCVTLPLDIIKLDRSLILAASATDAGRRFFGHILSGLHETGPRTIMEGVETQDQLDWATECKCEYIQGYYFSKPVDYERLLELT